MSLESRVLPEHLEVAEKLGKELRECIQNQDILYKQMERANKERNQIAYVELHELHRKKVMRELEISKELSTMYFEKMKCDRDPERYLEVKNVLDVAKRLEDVGGKIEVVEQIRKNA
ncbi:hypothetical protein NK358_27455 [Bacillus sp. S0635]|uniref:hypothetical protein n=1 Tax=Bacillus sp. S0635 TaxID=2957807 RepID=UPI00209CE078|nr:hypothetical protein [Bacillus sp. S0635]MCP1285360.1 hypothetical protein [Bacillus sp. S0635]